MLVFCQFLISRCGSNFKCVCALTGVGVHELLCAVSLDTRTTDKWLEEEENLNLSLAVEGRT